jgi:lipopolysaccharide assembly outer membrane protein LptD (OstA)
VTLRKRVLPALAAATLALLAGAPLSYGQSTPEPLKAQGQFRDAAVNPDLGQFFVAVYDRDAVWTINPANGDIATRINVGDGPGALALDGAYLAVANRLGNSVTIVRLDTLEVSGTLATGESPSAIVSIGGGRFVTANTFSDSLSVINAATNSVETITECPSVPVDLAVSGQNLAVVGRAEARVQLYDRDSLAPGNSVTLSAMATRVVAHTGETFVLASTDKLFVVNPASAVVTATRDMAVDDLSSDGGVLYTLKAGSLETLDAGLKTIHTETISQPATAVAASGGVVALLDPKSSRAQVENLNTLASAVPVQVAAQPEAPQPAPEPEPERKAKREKDGDLVIVEAAPVVTATTETPAPASVSEPAPAVVTEPEPAPEVTPAPEASPAVEAAPEQEPVKMAAEPAVEPAPAPARPTGTTPPSSASVRRNPIVTESVRAPSTGRPSASPMQQLDRKTITDALVQPTEFGSTTGGFQAPDLSKDLENVTASNISSAGRGAPTIFNEFRAQLGDMTMSADELTHVQEPVDLHAKGNVEIVQQSSTITADEIHFRLDPEAEATPEAPKILKGPEEEGPALDKGHLTLHNAHVVEPTREMTADYMDYDFKSGKGELNNATGQAGIYYFSAEKLHLHGPQTLSGENVWVTTCDRPHPHYKIRLSELEMVDGQPVAGSNARLQLGKADTPLYLPRWRRGGVGGSPWTLDFDSGRQADIGYFVNVGQAYEVNPDVTLGPRLFVTEKEGVGFGTDLTYDFMNNPASRFYRTQGEAHALYTTEDRGYVHWYHRYEYSNDLVVRAQVEHWGDEEFYKDFYYDMFRSRSQPRTFANITYRQPGYIATGTVRAQTHNWFSETEQTPEATFHYLERPLAENLYFSFDTANGYYNREPYGVDGARTANTARLTYSWDPTPGLAITPFWEADGYFYSRERQSDTSAGLLSTNVGVTAQTRLHRTYGGRWGFSAFKHMIVPSITYSYRPDTSVDPLEIPQYDPLDSIFGRSRIETKLSNVLYGRDAETGEVWQVGRLTFYQGNDLRNERSKTEDYEVELDVRPRPWWGLQVVGERQKTSDEDQSLSRYSIARNFPRFYQEVVGEAFGFDDAQDYSGRFGDYNRMLAQLYYDGEPRGEKVSGRVGFAYTKTQDEVFNREALYGLGYKFSDKWGFGFEHTYDFEERDLRSQTYELRRSLHCWETAIRFRDRESGFDINLEFNIKAFPGSRLKL